MVRYINKVINSLDSNGEKTTGKCHLTQKYEQRVKSVAL